MKEKLLERNNILKIFYLGRLEKVQRVSRCPRLPQAARNSVKTAGAVKIKMSRKEIWLSSHEKSSVIILKVYILSFMRHL